MNVRTLCLSILYSHDASGYEIRKLCTEGEEVRTLRRFVHRQQLHGRCADGGCCQEDGDDNVPHVLW